MVSEDHSPALSFCEITTDGSVTLALSKKSKELLDYVFRINAKIAGRYTLQSSLGRGGMGHVFLARDERLDRLVAIKVVANKTAVSDEELESALAQEAKLGAVLNHPGIAAVYDFGVHSGQCYTVFEYIEGLTLRDILMRRHQLPLDECQTVIGCLARALDFAHSHGIVHRDLKPENVCAAKNGELKILDLGLARYMTQETDGSVFSGTPAYAAPEQAACQLTDGRADQYALALMAYEMLCGRRVFVDADPIRLLLRHQSEAPENLQTACPGLPNYVSQAIMRSLEKDPAKRFSTCQEFSDAMGCREHPMVSSHLALDVPDENRISVYVSHSADDSLVARQIATDLADEHYSCWYYGRDALPGISYFSQTSDAIHRSHAILLLLSRAALNSTDFAREIHEAHHLNRPFLPVLVDLSSEEFEGHKPSWRSMLGSSAIIELNRHDLTDTTRRLTAAMKLLGLQPHDATAIEQGTESVSFRGQQWATDANQVDISDLDKIVFRNGIIDDFLSRRHKCFLSATKGLGKTLLLTYKRLLLTQTTGGGDPQASACLVPQGRPFLDFMSEMKSLSKKYEKPLSDLNTTKRIWSTALRISALSYHPGAIERDELFELEAFPRRIQRWLQGTKTEPTVVFKELTNLPISDLNRVIDESENFLDQKLRTIHSSTYFFIDKVDQAVRNLPRLAWINIQAGLIEAAWDLMNANSHVKVLATIRHEAFVNYESDIKSNLYGATTILRYSERELMDLLDNLVRCYEGKPSFRDFVGLNVVKHQRRNILEDSFQFVRRHTFGRPRDLVAIASELSANKTDLTEKKFCELVRRTSATGLVSNIFDEMFVFLDCLQDKSSRSRFLAGIPSNILSREEAIRVSADFNGLPVDSLDHIGTESHTIFHPFRDLYLSGLLGALVRDPESDKMIQKFRQADDFVSDVTVGVPKSSYYFVHPALNRFIGHYRTGGDYHVFQHVLVGENAVWEPHDGILCNIEKHAASISDHDLNIALHRQLAMVRMMLKTGKRDELNALVRSSADWKLLHRQLEADNQDDVILWLHELLETA